jgi:hypothetical protein
VMELAVAFFTLSVMRFLVMKFLYHSASGTSLYIPTLSTVRGISLCLWQLHRPVPVATCSKTWSAAARLLRLWVRIPPGVFMSVPCECCAVSGRGLYDEPITRPEESYRVWCVIVCDLQTSRMRKPWSALGRSAKRNKRNK